MRKGSKRKTNKKNKKLIWLVVLVLLVGIGFAALQKTLQINGNASIDSTFDVRITGITKDATDGGAYEKSAPTFTGTTASFDVGLRAPGDAMDYSIEISNNGDLNAKLEDILLDQTGSSNINYEVTGIEKGNIIEPWSSKKINVRVMYVNSGESDSEYSKEAKLTLLFVQTNDNTPEQEAGIAEFQNQISKTVENFRVISFDEEYVVIGPDGIGDGPGNPSTSFYDEYDNLVMDGFRNWAVNWETEKKVKSRDSISYNGTRYSNQFSELRTLYFEKLDNTFITNRYDGTNKEIVSVYPYVYTVTLPLNYKVVAGAFSASNVNKVIIPSGYDLSDLEYFSLHNSVYVNSSENRILNTIVNLTGESIDWANILGMAGSTCEFETGTCGAVTITNVQ